MNLVNPYKYVVSNAFVSSWNTANTSTGSSTSTQVKLPLVSTGTYNFIVNWGDGNSDTITAWNAAATTHTYASSGTYTITITGTCTGWRFNNTGDRLKILSISSWGSLKLGTVATQDGYFFGCANLSLSSVSDVLNLTGTNGFTSIFRSCTALTTINRINEWDTSGVYYFNNAFMFCTNFNSYIGGWNVQNGLNFGSMFQSASAYNQAMPSWSPTLGVNVTFNSMFVSATAFNQNLGGWNVSAVTDFTSMFQSATAFNNGGSSNINNWTLKNSGTINMTSMFRSCPFNQAIGNWNTAYVTNMSSMFLSNGAFNQNIGSWNVSSVITFNSMFAAASAFNNGGSNTINNWTFKTSGGTVNMASMFSSANSFNQPIGSWNVSNVVDLSGMFTSNTAFNNGLANGVAGDMLWSVGTTTTTIYSMFNGATAFNQNVGVWNLSNCSTLINLFAGATKFNNGGSSSINSWTLKTTGTLDLSFVFACPAFNQNVGSWNTSAATNMSGMFQNNTAFNQNIGSWNVSNVTNFSNFMLGKTSANFSTTNLDAIYNGWSALAGGVKPSITITFGSAKYTSASSAGRAILTGSPNNWTITDGGI